MTNSQYTKRYRHGARLKKIVTAWKGLPAIAKLSKEARLDVLLFATDAVGMDRTFVREKCGLDPDVPLIPDAPASDSENE